MAVLANLLIYVIMLCAVLGAIASIFDSQHGLGKEFTQGINSIGPIFVPVAGIMAAIPYLSVLVREFVGPIFAQVGADPSIAATTIIAVDMGGYNLAEVLAATKESWLIASAVGYMSGATIIFSIPVGLTMLKREDHKYMALGVMSGILSVPIGVATTCIVVMLFQPMMREAVASQGPATYQLGLTPSTIAANLTPLTIFVIAVALGLRFVPDLMIRLFMVFGRAMDAAIKMILVACIVEYFTHVPSALFSLLNVSWQFAPIIADQEDQFRALEIAGYIGIMLAGAFPMVYLIQKYLQGPMNILGKKLGLEGAGAAGLLASMANILAMFRLLPLRHLIHLESIPEPAVYVGRPYPTPILEYARNQLQTLLGMPAQPPTVYNSRVSDTVFNWVADEHRKEVMETDQNMLTGVLALKADLIDANQFVEACTVWTSRKKALLVDILVERGWLLESDRIHLNYLLERRLQKQGGNANAGLASVSDDIKCSLIALNDPEIQQSIAGTPGPATDTEMSETVVFTPQRDDRYEMKGLHATGGIGRIWIAHDKALDRDVALKDLRPERARDDSSIRARFLQEARITGRLEHPGIVPVYELAQRPGIQEPFYTMRFVKGRTLAQAASDYHRQRRQGVNTSFDLLTLLNAFVMVCKTVAFAHSRDIVHRDIKGQNVVLGGFGEAVLLDWGLAKDISEAETDCPQSTDPRPKAADDARLTLDGETVGTPAYMAPEQAAGKGRIDQRTDVYGLGAMLYEILTGQPPFTGTDSADILKQVLHRNPASPSLINDEVPDLLEVACMKALAKNPADRQVTAAELANEVECWQETRRRESRGGAQKVSGPLPVAYRHAALVHLEKES